MTTRKTTGRRSRVSKEAARNLEKSAQALGTLLILSAVGALLVSLFFIWNMLVYGVSTERVVGAVCAFLDGAVIFWCVRLLDQRQRLARHVFAILIFSTWMIALLVRFATRQPLFGWPDLAALILPVIVLTSMNHLITRKILN